MSVVGHACEPVVIAILAKDKAHVLPYYLTAIEAQTYPKNCTLLWIRSNNNNDNTISVLQQWVHHVRPRYAMVYENYKDVPESVEAFNPHGWNTLRFEVLGAIRDSSVSFADRHEAHYFVADCDNLIAPFTLERLVKLRLPVVAPMLTTKTAYSNYFAAVTDTGYFAQSPRYYWILNREITGIIQVPLVHCTYLINRDALRHVWYLDNSGRYEFVVLSDWFRRRGVAQYVDNRVAYGHITMADTLADLLQEPWFYPMLATICSDHNAFAHVCPP